MDEPQPLRGISRTDALPGGSRLERMLGFKGNFIQTWLARDVRGKPEVVKLQSWILEHTADYPPALPELDLREPIAALRLDRLLEVPRIERVSPWTALHEWEEKRCLVLRRPWFPARLADRPPASRAALLEPFRALALGIDRLCACLGEHVPLAIHPRNVLGDADAWVLTDWGQEPLHALIERSYHGPRTRSLDDAEYLDPVAGSSERRSRGSERARYGFAATYLFARAGLSPLETLGASAPFPQRLVAYVRSGPVLDAIDDPRERAVLERALSPDPSRRLASCVELVDAITHSRS